MGLFSTPQAAGALISAGGSLLGNVFGGLFNSSSNSLNYKMFKEANDFNRQERIASQDWQKFMLDYQNEYNDPSAMRQRMQDAGYNPFLTIGQGNLSAGASASPMATASAPNPMQPFRPDTSGFLEAGNMVGQSPLIAAQSHKENNLADYYDTLKDNALTQNQFFMSTWSGRKQAIALMNEKLQAEIYKTHSERDLNMANTALTNLNASARSILNDFLGPQQQINLLTGVQSLYNLYTQGKINERRFDQMAEEIVTMQLTNAGLRLSNKEKSYQVRYLKETIVNAIGAANMMHLDAETEAESHLNYTEWDPNALNEVTGMYGKFVKKDYYQEHNRWGLDAKRNWRYGYDRAYDASIYGTGASTITNILGDYLNYRATKGPILRTKPIRGFTIN